jgi:dipeptidyl aminopeptidase/acylaminoacyl peptidase
MKLITIALTIAVAAVSFAQGTKADYGRSERLPGVYRTKMFKMSVSPVWLKDGNRFWYRNDLSGGKREFILVNAKTGKRDKAFDHSKLAEALTKTLGKPVDAEKLPVQPVNFDKDTMVFQAEGKSLACNLKTYVVKPADKTEVSSNGLKPFIRPRPSRDGGEECTVVFENQTKGDITLIWVSSDGNETPYGTVKPGEKRDMHTYAGHVWKVVDAAKKTLAYFEAADGVAVVDGKSLRAPQQEAPRNPGLSPDGKWQAFVKDFNLFIRPAKTSEGAIQLSTDGKDQDAYSIYSIDWSPDSKKIVAMRIEAGYDHKVYVVESSPRDQVQPKLHTWDYVKPGDKLAFPRPQIFDIATKKQTTVSTDLFPNPYAIEDVRWSPDSSHFLFQYNQRGHQVYRVLSVDANTGNVKPIIDEKSAENSFIDYSQKTVFELLEPTHEIIWASERDGWNHLYLIDSETGKIKNQITKGNWVMRQIDRIDPVKRQIWFQVLGYYPNQDPYYTHFARVNFDGTGLTLLTEGDGTHKIAYSPDGRYLLDSYSRVDMAPVTELRKVDDGKLVCQLEKADITEAEKAGRPTTEHFVTMGRDGKTPIYGLIQRPSNFDPNKKYPVIEQIYAGPHGFSTPKGFAAFQWAQQMAELGFIVVQIDGMGTNWRSRAFHDVCWKNIGDAGFPDRIIWMKEAAKKYPYMDITKVGIIGGSAGGQNAARAVFAFGDFYKVAVADCGCHDNRMDKIWWNEAWMGWPIGKEYEEQSNVTCAKNLTGKLFLVVGEMDNNVDPATTMQVVNALIKANKDFDLLVVPGAGHCPTSSPYGKRRAEDFLVRNLLGVEPRN